MLPPIHYLLTSVGRRSGYGRGDAPGGRWEVEFFDDPEVEALVSDGTLHGPEKLVEIAQKGKNKPGFELLQTFEARDYNWVWASREAATAARCG